MLEYNFSPYYVFLPINFNENINKRPIIIMSGNKRCKNCDIPINSLKFYCISCKKKLKKRKIFTLNPPPPPPYNQETVINIPSPPPPPPPYNQETVINIPSPPPSLQNLVNSSELLSFSIQTNTISSLIAALENDINSDESKT